MKNKNKKIVSGSFSGNLSEFLYSDKRLIASVSAVFIILLAIVVPVAVYRSLAATGGVAFEAETGTRSSMAYLESDQTAAGGQDVKFCPPSQTGGTLSVNAANNVHAFSNKILGIGEGNWTFNFGSPYINSIPGLSQLAATFNPGLIRYAGGLKANYIGFDRNQKAPVFDTAWTFNGQTYFERYGTDELASLDAFAKSINAQVMIQVNVSNNDPSMWADLVRYAKEKNWTTFKYYEMANELDLETFQSSSDAVNPSDYGARVKAYSQAMLAVDPAIKIVGGVPATASDIMRNGYGSGGNLPSAYITSSLDSVHSTGKDMAAVSFHWYQGGNSASEVGQWTWGNTPGTSEWWRESYARDWSGKVVPWLRSTALASYPSTELGISELGVDSDNTKTSIGNHLGALWFSDVLGRLAYTGLDWANQWDGYVAGQDEAFGLFYSGSNGLNVRPTYYAYLMYGKYFGDQMVQSGSYDESKLSVWASKDSKDPNKLKLRLTNMTCSAISSPVSLGGFSTTGGGAYVMSSTSPADSSTASTYSSASTNINGVKINANSPATSISSIQPQAVSASGTSFTYTVPAYSSVALVMNGTFQ